MFIPNLKQKDTINTTSSASTVFTNSNIFWQTYAPNITHILESKIIGILMMLEEYLLELESVFI
jgi:hypothetical protein